MYAVYIISIFIICVYIGYYINKNFIECRSVVNDALNKGFRDRYYKLNYVSNKCKHCLLSKVCNKNASIIKDKIYGKDVDWNSILIRVENLIIVEIMLSVIVMILDIKKGILNL